MARVHRVARSNKEHTCGRGNHTIRTGVDSWDPEEFTEPDRDDWDGDDWNGDADDFEGYVEFKRTCHAEEQMDEALSIAGSLEF